MRGLRAQTFDRTGERSPDCRLRPKHRNRISHRFETPGGKDYPGVWILASPLKYRILLRVLFALFLRTGEAFLDAAAHETENIAQHLRVLVQTRVHTIEA